MSEPTTPWFISLTESVYALGTAAREFRAAYRTAQTASWHVDPARVLPVDGSVSVVDAMSFIRPHDEALRQLGEAYGRLDAQVHQLYENAALAYAYGTAGVLLAIACGGCPEYVHLGRKDGLYVPEGGALPNLQYALSSWPGAGRLAELQTALHERQLAGQGFDDLPPLDCLTQYEASMADDTAQFARGLADSAYAYGEMAERALHFLLLQAKSDRHSEDGER